MYHPARVLQRIPVEAGGTAFLVETWDRNTFTVAAADELDADSVSPDDVVLLDYYPDDRFDVPTPRQVVAARLDEEAGKRIWEQYQQLFEESQQQQTAMMQQMPQQFDGGYIG